ncbi:MAG: type II toxin-antitoxin system VapC family toxin [Schwartzia sp.]|nr:type II toxin-antitoxin system VapC family toxin [Schwartzia sp. (in: firmicutes)]
MKRYFDTAIFIYALENKSERARRLITDSVHDGIVGISSITIMEYCAGCFRHGRPDIAARFQSFLRDYGFEIHPIQEDTALEAARIRALYPAFKPMDSLQLASAVMAEADEFHTNDKQLLQFTHERTKIVRFDSAALDNALQ